MGIGSKATFQENIHGDQTLMVHLKTTKELIELAGLTITEVRLDKFIVTNE